MSTFFNRPISVKVKQGLKANINTTATKNSAVTGELHYCTDTKELYIFDGANNILVSGGFTGTFTNGDGDTVTVTNGIITDVS